MSLAMYAAPFDNNENQINDKDNESPIARKRITNNRTQKRVPKDINSEKVNSVLQTIHNLPDQLDTESDGLADFNPLPPPTSVGVEQTRIRETVSQETSDESMENYNKSISRTNQEYYSRFMPNYDQLYKQSPNNVPYYTSSSQSNNSNESNPNHLNSLLLQKINYMINLLEEQQDERTNNVTEEVILYSFLGIFIIFLVDSFVRVGKYVR